MNLHPSVDDPGGPLAPSDWTMSLGFDMVGKTVHYFGDVYRDSRHVCRLSVIGAASEAEAPRRLALKARLWIDDYLRRPHSDNTELGTLT